MFQGLRQATPFQRPQTLSMVQKLAPASRRAYSSEMANALVQVSQNLGMGQAAIGLGGGKSILPNPWMHLQHTSDSPFSPPSSLLIDH